MDTLVKIYFGRNLNNPYRQEELTNEEFNSFLQNEVVPLYEGFTINEAIGFWKGQQEKTFVIEILTNHGIETERKIEHISRTYVSRYNQEAVMITRQEVKSTLYTPNTNALKTA